MRIRKQQHGFATVELVVVIIIVVAIVVVGWWVYQGRNNTTTTTSNTTSTSSATQSPVAHNVSTAPPVNSTSDLDKALNTLSQNNPSTTNSSDSNLLGSESNF